MAFTVPQMPLLVDVYRGPWLSKVFAFQCPGNLQLGRAVRLGYPDFEIPQTAIFNGGVQLLVPKGTDLRTEVQGFVNDIVEIPSGTGRWYQLVFVEDVGKGFSNEFRLALAYKICQGVDASAYPGLLWPVPMP